MGDKTAIETRLLRSDQAAKYLNLDVWTIRTMIRNKELKAIRRPGKRTPWLIDIRECDRWIEKNSVTGPTLKRY